jgi:hypothetical protein
MADKKISQLTGATTPLAGTEVLPIVQSGSTVKVASNDLTVKNIRSNATTGILQVAGPGAGTTRTVTVPDANFTAARTDAAQTFTGDQTFGTVLGTTFDTNVAAAGVTLSGTTLAADGTTTDIGITITPKGAGVLSTTSVNASGDVTLIGAGNTRLVGFNFYGGLQYNLFVDGTSDASSMVIRQGTTAAAIFNSAREFIVGGTTDQGAYNLQCNGTGVWGAGAYVNGSDARIKKDIAPIASGLDVVEKLNPVTYCYKEDWSKDQNVQTGFIAQELLTALDGQVYVDGVVQQNGAEGYYSVAYQNIIPILTKAIQEQQNMIKSLEAKVTALENK